MSGAGDAPVRMRWRRLDWPGWARRAAAAAYLALLTGSLLVPGSTFEEVGGLFAYEDKVVHVGLFVALALLARWSLPGGGGGGRKRGAAAAALALYAGAIEALQPLLSGGERLFEWGDLASNLAGLCAGWLLFRFLSAGARPGAGAW